MALRDDIKASVNSTPPAVLAVPTPELPKYDGQIYVTRICPRAVAACFRDVSEEDAVDERAAFVVQVASDSAGSRIFQDEDVLWLSTTAMLTPMVERLYWAGRYHNGLTEENRSAWRKNLSSTAGSGSPCSSAVRSTPDSASASTAS
jgi:hypothetical protein